MSALSKAIRLAVPSGGQLVVTRDDEAQTLKLAVIIPQSGPRRVFVDAHVILDVVGWNDLLHCVALPPAIPAGSFSQGKEGA